MNSPSLKEKTSVLEDFEVTGNQGSWYFTRIRSQIRTGEEGSTEQSGERYPEGWDVLSKGQREEFSVPVHAIVLVRGTVAPQSSCVIAVHAGDDSGMEISALPLLR